MSGERDGDRSAPTPERVDGERATDGEPTARRPSRGKAIAMISGGLDSSLALEHVRRMGFEVKAVNFYTGFCITETHRRVGGRPRDGVYPPNEALGAAARAETEVELVDISDDYVEVVTNPQHGYGKNMNPCIDCRIFMMQRAREIMEAEGADFVFTGEVMGQRPKSQRRDALAIVARESGLGGRLVRPLSGRHLPATDPENEGLFEREELLGMTGRSRKPQIALAEEYGILDYPQPAGGCCFLTDESYARRLRDLIEHRADRRYRKEDIVLLSVGRHFRFEDGGKLVVSRNEAENPLLERYLEGRWRLEAVDIRGPVALFEGEPSESVRDEASAVVARYGQGRSHPRVPIEWRRGDARRVVEVAPMPDGERMEALRV